MNELALSPLPGLRVLPVFLTPTAYAVGYNLSLAGRGRGAIQGQGFQI